MYRWDKILKKQKNIFLAKVFFSSIVLNAFLKNNKVKSVIWPKNYFSGFWKCYPICTCRTRILFFQKFLLLSTLFCDEERNDEILSYFSPRRDLDRGLKIVNGANLNNSSYHQSNWKYSIKLRWNFSKQCNWSVINKKGAAANATMSFTRSKIFNYSWILIVFCISNDLIDFHWIGSNWALYGGFLLFACIIPFKFSSLSKRLVIPINRTPMRKQTSQTLQSTYQTVIFESLLQ